jgi:hypothetical protein
MEPSETRAAAPADGPDVGAVLNAVAREDLDCVVALASMFPRLADQPTPVRLGTVAYCHARGLRAHAVVRFMRRLRLPYRMPAAADSTLRRRFREETGGDLRVFLGRRTPLDPARLALLLRLFAESEEAGARAFAVLGDGAADERVREFARAQRRACRAQRETLLGLAREAAA